MAARLDASRWRPAHTRIATALGVGWVLDAFEVQIIGSVIPGIQAEFGLGASQAVVINVVWFLGIAVGVGGECSAITSAISEFIPARTPGRSNGLVMTFWALGGILSSLVSILVISTLGLTWRYTLLFGVVSAAYGLLARRLVPESPRWLASRGRLDEADAVVESITGQASATGYVLPPTAARGGSALGELWTHHRGKLFFGMALDFSEAAGYYGLFTAMSVFVFSSASGAVPISDGALPYYFLVANVGALAGGVLVAFTVAAFFATCAWVSAYPTFSEQFPTHLRATGVGASVGVGRMGGVIGQVLLAEVAVVFSVTSMFVLLAGFWLIGSVAGGIWWARGTEARGVTLEELERVPEPA